MQKNSLTDLFSEEDRQSIDQRAKTLIWDGHNMAYRSLFSAVFLSPEDNDKFFLFRHIFMNSMLQTIKKFNPERVVLAFDVKRTWRYEVFPEYKKKRKGARDKAVVDFKKFFPIFNEFREEIKDTFTNMYVLEIPRAEADDTIAILIKEKFQDQKTIIVSTDKDMHQLLTNPNVQQYDPIKQKMVQCINPKQELSVKLIVGDKGDGIPAIKPMCGPATAEKILKAGLDDYLSDPKNKEIKENYIRNTTLIDFNFIPRDLANSIINTYCNYEIKEIEGSKLMKFLSKNRLKKIMDDWQNYSDLMRALR